MKSVALLTLLTLAADGWANGEPPDRPLLITDVTVIDCTGGPARPDREILVEGGRIVEVREAHPLALHPGVAVIDGHGKFLIPGLWDMHVHLTDHAALDQCLAHGVTGVRHMYSISPLFSPAAELRRPSPGRPRVVCADGALDGPDTLFPVLLQGDLVLAADARQAREGVAQLARDGNDFIKVFSMLPRDAYFAAAEEAKRRGLPLAGHVPPGVTPAEASDAGQASIEHLDGLPAACAHHGADLRDELLDALAPWDTRRKVAGGMWRFALKAHEDYDPQVAAVLFARFVRNGTRQVPTLVESHAKSCLGDAAFVADPRLARSPRSLRILWKVENLDGGAVELPRYGLHYGAADLLARKQLFDAELRLVGAMHKAGVTIMAGTDAPNPYCFFGSGLHDELELLVRAGLSPMEALQAATREPARFLGRDKELGTVEAGKAADLVLLDADPLEKIANVRKVAAVLAGGRYFGREELRKLAEP